MQLAHSTLRKKGSIMSFNIPITVAGDVSTDGITRPNGYGSVELGSVIDLSSVFLKLNEDDDMQEKRCAHCTEDMDPDNPAQVVEGDRFCDSNDGPHVPEWSPLTWAKNVTIETDEEADAIHVTIAHADPRGGWQMTIRRMENGQLIMHLPYEGMSSPHASMRKITEGTYEVG